jgi:uncharacterized protein YfaS (alpha-2-macroglobulin family)
MKARILIFLISIIGLVGCSSNNESASEEDIAKYISNITQGEVNPETNITIDFVKPMLAEESLNEALEEIPFRFSPKIDGEAKWLSKTQLVFIPAEPLRYGKSYKVTLLLNDLPGNIIPEGLEQFIFVLDVNQNMVADFKGAIDLKTPTSPKILQYKADFSLASPVKKEQVGEGIKCELDGKTLGFELSGSGDEMTYRLVSNDITRDDENHTLIITLDKDKMGLFEDNVEMVEITPLSTFKVLNVSHDAGEKNPEIRVAFSDRISLKQNIDGLVKVDPAPGDLKLQRLGKTVLIEGDFKYGNDYEVLVQKNIESVWGTKTKKLYTQKISFPNIEPQVEFASSGLILPSSNKFIVQFYTCNLQRVHLELKKVYNENLDDFIRSEQISSQADRKSRFTNNYESNMGLILHNETFEISNQKNSWKLNEIDLSKEIAKNGKGLYLIRLNFTPKDLLTSVQDEYKYINQNGQVFKPIIMSDIGLLCKKVDDEYLVLTTDLNNAKQLADVDVQIKSRYNRSERYILKGKTRDDGMVRLRPEKRYNSYHYIIAQKGTDRTIMKFDESEWNISGYDIGGLSKTQLNTQAFIYTERGVYRPGDEINLSVIARHLKGAFPDNKKITVELLDPRNKSIYTNTSRESEDGFFNFTFQTKQSDPTGNWTARFYIGNSYFSHTVKIETIVPYKLKTNISVPKKTLFKADKTLAVDVDCKYLFGTPAKENPVEMIAEYSDLEVKFPRYSDFVFSNPTIEYISKSKKLDDSKFDNEGLYSKTIDLPEFSGVPSAINLKLSANVMEKGGRKNNNWVNVKINPYDTYVGIQKMERYYKAETDLSIPVIVVDPMGNPIAGKKIRYNIYKNEDYWWWQYNNRQLRYKSNSHTQLVEQGTLVSGEQHALIRYMPVKRGSYYIEIYDDEEGAHSAGYFFSVYNWSSSSQGDNSAGMLLLSSDKDKYIVGETAHVSFPSPGTGRVMVSVEKGDEMVSMQWYQPKPGEQMEVEVPITDKMTPNVYVSVLLLQPHAETRNDRPLRMFGVLPINVVDPKSKFDVDITTTDEFRPEETFEIDLQTSNYQKAQFTIAVVDEGLLDITRFKTPNPWSYFFRKIRLGVRTFDVFSQVISANIGDVFKTFSIGGDMDYRESQLEPDSKKKRFKPVSLFEGPLETDQNGRATVKFTMPNYIGSVRIMAVAANGKSYASAEKTVPVKKELMVLPTLPRVIGPDEEFVVPATIFAMKDNLGEVRVQLKTEGPIEVVGDDLLKVSFNKAGDEDCFFRLKTKKAAGASKVIIEVSNGEFEAKNVTDLHVRPSAPRIYNSLITEIDKGQDYTLTVPATGIDGTNRASFTIAGYPGMNFKRRLNWLIHYPYGCIEQTTSSVFPQLYLNNFIDFTESEKREIDDNINAGIARLNHFQLYSGGFSYWPGRTDVSEWGTVYAAHFLVEAKNRGYYVPDDLYNKVIEYMRNSVRSIGNLRIKSYYGYVLALSGNAVNSELNVLAESHFNELDNPSRWLLAASCKLAGMTDLSSDIIRKSDVNVKEYIEFSGTYGSTLRDRAMILDAMVTLEEMDKAFALMLELSKAMDNHRWYSTQTVGYVLLANGRYISKMVDKDADPLIQGTIYYPDGKKKDFSAETGKEIVLDPYIGEQVRIEITDKTTFSKVFGILTNDGVPLKSELGNTASNLSVVAQYYTEEGAPLDPGELEQGSSFWIHLHAENMTEEPVDEVALMYMLPSGWEFQNTRLQTEVTPPFLSNLRLNKEEYVDIRDDRMIWFFDMNAKIQPYIHHKNDFIAKVNVVTIGSFQLPPVLMEAMYNNTYRASIAGRKVKVVKRD